MKLNGTDFQIKVWKALKKIKKGKYLIYGQGLGGLYAQKNTTLDFGNSGTLCRLGSGLLSTSPDLSLKITGDKSLQKRNLKTLIHSLSKFGAFFYPEKRNYLPLKLISSNNQCLSMVFLGTMPTTCLHQYTKLPNL